MDNPEIRVKVDLSVAHDSMVQVLGTYREVDIRKRPQGEPVYAGHAAVELDDGTLVFLTPPWGAQAIRTDDERATRRGTRVAALGMAVDSCPPDPSGGASIVAPCLMMVAALVAEELYLAGKELGGLEGLGE
jgi:hypothetical protein